MSRPPGLGLLLCILAALAAANFLVYAGVWRFDFVNFDDPQYILENSHIEGGLTRDSVLWALGTDYASNWHPLTWWSYMLDEQIYGATAGALHVTKAASAPRSPHKEKSRRQSNIIQRLCN